MEYKRLTNQKWSENIDLKQELGYSHIYKRLYELEDKIEAGTLVELPCKVGDVMYEVFKNHKPPFIQQTKIEKVIITNKGLRLKLERNSVYETSVSSLGKTLFDTEEKAEKKLEELKNEWLWKIDLWR